MLKMNVSYRSRCPGTQDGICTNPNEKQRRPLEENYIFNARIPTGEDLTLLDCIADTLRDRDQRWCTECSTQMRRVNPDTTNRDDRAWRYIRDCPEVLFTRLERFREVPTKKGVRDEKIIAPLAIPETLDLSEFLEYHSYGEGSVFQYELRGVVSHIGTIKGRHYVAHVKEGKNWWRVDDQGTPTVTASSIARMNFGYWRKNG
jgi:ubiquitin C-terminal hydrolase